MAGPELGEREACPEEDKRGQGRDEEGAVHGAVKRNGADPGESPEKDRAENNRAKKEDEEEKRQDESGFHVGAKGEDREMCIRDRRKGDGYQLYSIGWDQKDDGGVLDTHDPLFGDWPWPSP